MDSSRKYHQIKIMKGTPTKGWLTPFEPNPDKIEAILDMQPPREYKDIQKLIGYLAAVSQFISKSDERNLPFFKNLRQVSNKFYWDMTTIKCLKS
ncbi:hypothetical protein LIER_35449 [Lithospermum erythrorhizon]|uniref:Uncharacterized protein n=1 Tax=Lithospermum erythrorhizon TaxID=34254 RepID=A0AAV3NVI4_LITER